MNTQTVRIAGITLPPPSPDFGRLNRVLRRQGEPDRVPLIELMADRESMEGILGETLPVPDPGDFDLRRRALDQAIRFWHLTGYDYITVTTATRFVHPRISGVQSDEPRERSRKWVNEAEGIIQSWEDFANYPWPDPSAIDCFDLDYVSRNLPEGMQITFRGHGGILENAMWLMGFAPFAIALKDDPALIAALTDKIGLFLETLYSDALQRPEVGAVWLGDDMGFKTSTMISPDDLRRYIFPWQKKLVEIAHAHNKPLLLHSCGNLGSIMNDLIDDVGIDAKHSFEDIILPAAKAKKLYGDRIAILGGVDIDVLCRSSEQDLRAYMRRIIDECAPDGGWALGTGNSVANYIPLKNYLVMLDEGRRYGVYR
jgi:uroporphyrinogen decarboxylase